MLTERGLPRELPGGASGRSAPGGRDIVLATPNGPRPAIFVVSREPQGLKFDQSKEFASRYIPFGMDAMYGVTPAFWQTAVRVLPT